MAYTVGRGLTEAERQDIKEAFELCADVPEGPDHGCARVLSRHGLTCAMMSLLGYKPATVRTTGSALCHGVLALSWLSLTLCVMCHLASLSHSSKPRRCSDNTHAPC